MESIVLHHFTLTREFVNFNNNARNSINVTKTLASKHQKSLASRYYSLIKLNASEPIVVLAPPPNTKLLLIISNIVGDP
jgi:hypothetical protein